MNTKSDTFFNDAEKKAVEAAIRDAESHTSGEIVTMLVDKSDGYRDIDVITGITVSAIIALYPAELIYASSEFLLRKFIPSLSWFTQIPDGMRFITGITAFIAVTVILQFPVKYLFSRFPALKRVFIPSKRMDAEVKERALRGFHEHGLGSTKDATGVLFLISLLEKRVYILADHGIYTKIKQETLDGYAAAISKGIASGKGGEALCDAIKDAGRVLEKHFPRKTDDVNELSDSIITEK